MIRVTRDALLSEALVTQDSNPIRAQFIKWDCRKANRSSANTAKRRKAETSTPVEDEVCEWQGAGLMSENGPLECRRDPPHETLPEPGPLARLGLGLLGLARRRPS